MEGEHWKRGFEHGLRWGETATDAEVVDAIREAKADAAIMPGDTLADLFQGLGADTPGEFFMGALRGVFIAHLVKEQHRLADARNRTKFEEKLDALASGAVDAAFENPESNEIVRAAEFLINYARADSNQRATAFVGSNSEEMEMMKAIMDMHSEISPQTHDNDE